MRPAHSADLRSRLRHVSSAQTVAYSTGCSRVVTRTSESFKKKKKSQCQADFSLYQKRDIIAIFNVTMMMMTGDNNKKRGSASYIVREVRSVRERERERERDTETDGSDVTLVLIVALKLAMSFALFLAKNLHLSLWR